MTESQIQTKIVNHLRKTGWFVFKINDRFTYGIPDLYIVKNGQSIWLEVKKTDGKLSRIQIRTIKDLKDHGASVFVVDSLEKVKAVIDHKPSWNYQNHILDAMKYCSYGTEKDPNPALIPDPDLFSEISCDAIKKNFSKLFKEEVLNGNINRILNNKKPINFKKVDK